MAKQKFYCKVVGHQRVQAKRLPDRCKITMRGTEIAGLKIEFLIDEADRELYPYGAKGVFVWDVQQTLELVDQPEKAAEAPALAGAVTG